MTDVTEKESVLREEILRRVREIARLRLSSEGEFVPGKTPVRYAGRVYGEEEMVNLAEASIEFWLTAGRWHRKFERDLAAWYGLPHARLVNSGSSANLLAVAALMSPSWGNRRLKRGDEVITVAAGFPTTVAPIIQLGAVPVFVDVTIPGYNVDAEGLEAALSPRTRAVILAHTLGNPFDLDRVTAFCREHDLWLVEDNCDASGSLYRGIKTGTFGDIATLSFYPPHHMTTGEGGAVLCRSDEMKRVLESLRDWGRDCWCAPGVDNTCGKRFEWKLGSLPEGYDHKYIYSNLGFNLKMTDMQAAVGCAQLRKLDSFGEARRVNWRFYRDALTDLNEFFVLPELTEGSDPSWFGFMLLVRETAPFTREDVVRHLESKKIQTRMLFAGNLVRQPAFKSLQGAAVGDGGSPAYRVVGDLRSTDRVMASAFWFGVYPGLDTSRREYVVQTIRQFVGSRTTR
jgi:CDP-6-deoxy-D-xylo-4-hexulose-3-dehydrase